MSDYKGIGPEPPSATATGAVCPYLGWYVDAETHHAYPSLANHCHTQEPPLTIELAYQGSTCLEGEWMACPRYKAAVSEGVVQRAAPVPWLSRAGVRRLPTWAIATIAVAALVVIAGLFLALRPATSATVSPTPTVVVSSDQNTPVSVLGPTATEPASPTPSPTPSLPPTDTPPPPTPTATTTFTPSPTATPRVSPTALPVGLTPSPTPTPSQTATATRTQTPTATPRPSPPTPTPEPAPVGVQFPAPVLVSPGGGRVYSDRDTITLTWQPVGQLAPNEYYVPTVAFSPVADPSQTWYDDTPWIKETSWTLSEHRYLLTVSSNGEFRWAVQVMRRTGIDNDGKPDGIAISPMSEVRTLIWKPGSGGGGAQNTPVVPPP